MNKSILGWFLLAALEVFILVISIYDLVSFLIAPSSYNFGINIIDKGGIAYYSSIVFCLYRCAEIILTILWFILLIMIKKGINHNGIIWFVFVTSMVLFILPLLSY